MKTNTELLGLAENKQVKEIQIRGRTINFADPNALLDLD